MPKAKKKTKAKAVEEKKIAIIEKPKFVEPSRELKAELAEETKKIEKKAVAKEPEFKVKRIRMLMGLANDKYAYTPGQSYEVGKDVSEASAKEYLKKGLAELDASGEGPSETK